MVISCVPPLKIITVIIIIITFRKIFPQTCFDSTYQNQQQYSIRLDLSLNKPKPMPVMTYYTQIMILRNDLSVTCSTVTSTVVTLETDCVHMRTRCFFLPQLTCLPWCKPKKPSFAWTHMLLCAQHRRPSSVKRQVCVDLRRLSRRRKTRQTYCVGCGAGPAMSSTWK